MWGGISFFEESKVEVGSYLRCNEAPLDKEVVFLNYFLNFDCKEYASVVRDGGGDDGGDFSDEALRDY